MRKSRESQLGLVLEQKLKVWKMPLLQLGEKHPVPQRRGWGWAARENMEVKGRMRTGAGAVAGGMSCSAEVGREDLSPVCRRVLIRGDLVPFGPQVSQWS